MANQFYKGLQADFSDVVEEIQGASYVSWPVMMARAGLPIHRFVEFEEGQHYLEVFGGAVVACEVTTEEGTARRAYLPVLTPGNMPVPVNMLNVRDLNDTMKRVLVKAIGMGMGFGLSYYAKGLHANDFLEAVGVYPDDNLATVEAGAMEKRDKKGNLKAKYLGWPHAVAAAAMTDPSFRWEVMFFDVQCPDPETGEVRVKSKPYRLGPNGGYFVSLKIHYKGREHIEHMPILGIDIVQTKQGPKPMEHRPNLNPDVADWNASVMRGLARGIAVATGYGLSIYADEAQALLMAGGVFVDGADADDNGERQPASNVSNIDRQPRKEAPPPASNKAPEGKGDDGKPVFTEERRAKVEAIKTLMEETKTDKATVLKFYNHEGLVSEMPDDKLEKLHANLLAKKRRMDAVAATSSAAAA